VLTLSERVGNEGKGEKAQEENIELFEAGEDAAEALEPPEKASISLRLRYIARSYSQGSRRLLLGGTTGI